MCGGSKEAYDQTLPLLQIMGDTINYFGESGSGQRTKMSNQILIASTMVGTVESLLYAEKANLDLNQVIEMIRTGCCWLLVFKSTWSANVQAGLGTWFLCETFCEGHGDCP